jgi:alkyldihydroxyacetonephosphate synthase
MPVNELNPPRIYRDEILKWNGWGYVDSYFSLDENDDVIMTGKRYDISEKVIPLIRPWIERNLGIGWFNRTIKAPQLFCSLDLSYRTPSVQQNSVRVPEPIVNVQFLEHLRKNGISFSDAPNYRLVRSHGHTIHDIMALRSGEVDRVPDVVAFPQTESEIEKIVQSANECDVVIIPIGGGTSVTNALNCPPEEQRAICSVDMALMNKIVWIDEDNLLCRVQAGIVGQELEKQLNQKGFTCGHEPDSIEFSTLGGWIATRASGMKKNKYGNIEDLLVHVNIVTVKGIFKKNCQVPRISCGPDLHHLVLGSEGTYGVISEASIKIFPLPECRKFGSIVFPNFQQGIRFFREVARQRCQPASLRLMDNEQFVMGQAMKLKSHSLWHDITSSLSKLYVTTWKGFKVDEMVAATCVFEGSSEEVDQQQRRLSTIAAQFNGVMGGEENGRYGYRLTFAIAYLRDLGMEYGVIGESFETSVPWDKVESLCRNVKRLLAQHVKEAGVDLPALTSCR